MIAIGNDQAGYGLKLEITKRLSELGIEFKDFGSHSAEAVDYPVYAELVADAVLSGECARGILVCGTGIGVSMCANRKKGIRAAVCHDVFSAKATRSHNDANILAMGARVIGTGAALEVLDAFLNTPFSGEERHARRNAMLDGI